MLSSSFTFSMLTHSALPRFMPLTPEAVLPITLISFSSKTFILPSEEANKILDSPFVFLTPISSSFSFSFIQIFPVALIFSNSSRFVRFIKPCFVAKIKYFSWFSTFNFIILLIFSSFSTGNTLTIGNPLDCLLNSGISYPFNLYTFPLLVNIII